MSDETEGIAWLHAQRRITVVELAQTSGLAEDVVIELVECGALEPVDDASPRREFGADQVSALRAAARLLGDLEIEPPALPLVVALLRRIERLEAQARALRAQIQGPPPPG